MRVSYPPASGEEAQEDVNQYQTIAVTRAITKMCEQLGEPQVLGDFAHNALMSPFHFHRVFRKVTTSTPGRFLTALRIARARSLLLETCMTVADISRVVGYSSVGTFTTQFTRLVGVAPGRFRAQAALMGDLIISDLVKIDPRPQEECQHRSPIWVKGRPDGSPGIAVVGLFDSRIAQGAPITCAVVKPPGPVWFPVVASHCAGHVLVVSVTGDATVGEILAGSARAGVFIGSGERAVDLNKETRAAVRVELREQRLTDPPILTAFPLLTSHAPQA